MQNTADQFHIIVNPAGASGRTGQLWERLAPICEARGQNVQVHYSMREHGVTEICRELTQGPSGAGRSTSDTPGNDDNGNISGTAHGDINIVIVGGDGTMNEALNGIEDFQHVRLGLVPAGSGNDLARDLGLPDRPEEVLTQILRGETARTFDLGTLTIHGSTERIDLVTDEVDASASETEIRRVFAVSCGIGFDAAICRQAAISPLKSVLNKIHLGKLIYLVEAIHLIFTLRNGTMQLTLDGETVREFDYAMFSVCMNHRYEGGGFMFGPEAADDDGLLEICTASPRSNAAFFYIFPFAYKGHHVRFRPVHMDRAHEVDIVSDHPLWVHMDGEVHCKSNHITVSLRQQAVRFLV